MTIQKFKICVSTSVVTLLTLSNSFAGSFTAPKNTYLFASEYTGTFKDDSEYAQGLEINNEFGVTENQSIALDLFFDKANSLNSDEAEDLIAPWSHAFEIRHRMNFKYSDSINFGLQNALKIAELGDDAVDAYSKRWELRGMARHDTKSGFYKHSRFELSYRRNFKFDTPDVLRFLFRADFRITHNINFVTKAQVFFLLASQGYINNNPDLVDAKRINHYSFKTFKASDVVLTLGPTFNLSNGDSIYVRYEMQVDSSRANRKHAKGFVLGFEREIDLK